MSRNAEVTLAWGDGEYKFRLGIGEVRELQEKTSCGPYFLLGRVDGGQWFIDDLRETIRIGLIGGGLEPVKALALAGLLVISAVEELRRQGMPMMQALVEGAAERMRSIVLVALLALLAWLVVEFRGALVKLNHF